MNLGTYELLKELGRGANGIVFRAYDPAVRRPVAIKVISTHRFSDERERAETKLRFAREAAAAGKLSHPNIVTIYQFVEEDDTQFLVMELVAGMSLEKI